MLAARFIDTKLEEEMNENGFVVIKNFLSSADVGSLTELYKTYHKERIIGCWNSLYDLPLGYGTEISEKLTATVRPYLAKYFKDWKFPAAHFIVKNPGRDHESLVHRDDSMHNENEVQYRQCWIPIVDTTETNGALYVVPRSHKLFTDERPMFAAWPYIHLRERLEREFLPVYMKAGDMIVYFEKTLHGSPKNLSSEPRPVFQGGLMHKDAVPLFTKYIAEKNEVESYEVDVEFFLNKEYLKPVIDSRYPLVSSVKYSPKTINEAELDKFFSPVS
jgi:ectoine hydroxylase-related dioxygenase (phytanoyl-CoA dioxygenase family)